MFYADLHVHSKFSRATSRDCDLEHLAVWAGRKGLAVLGTGDFTHPQWMEEIREKLRPAEPGLFRLKVDLEREVRRQQGGSSAADVRFLLQVEIATIYKRDGRTRKVHHLVYAPDFDCARRIAERLGKIGNLKSDGRPILGLDSRELLAIVLDAGKGTFLVPAHVWTPWFAALGSRSGFDAIDECYGDLSGELFALETGLSSDPPMNRRLSALDRFALVSNSDAHSPSRLAREATAFHSELDYFAMRQALKTGRGFGGTVEFFPEEGKYHWDGHRKCGVRLDPGAARRYSDRCPVCGGALTLGVLHRIEALADRPDASAEGAEVPPFRSLIPLAEVLGEVLGVGPQSKAVQVQFDALVTRLGPELFLLERALLDDVARAGSPRLAEALRRMRRGEVIRQPGFDGEYGKVRLFEPEKKGKGDRRRSR